MLAFNMIFILVPPSNIVSPLVNSKIFLNIVFFEKSMDKLLVTFLTYVLLYLKS